eukprot:jgi/Botrbrau1/21201/Bobra.39_2s0004.1
MEKGFPEFESDVSRKFRDTVVMVLGSACFAKFYFQKNEHYNPGTARLLAIHHSSFCERGIFDRRHRCGTSSYLTIEAETDACKWSYEFCSTKAYCYSIDHNTGQRRVPLGNCYRYLQPLPEPCWRLLALAAGA